MEAELTGSTGPEPPARQAVWSDQHDGLRPSPLVLGWLRAVDAAAAPLVALRVPADAVTVAGAVVAFLAVPAAAAGRPGVAGTAILLSGLLDALDGAVARGSARRSGRRSAHGALLDRGADRVGEVAAGVALLLLGAPWWLVGAAVLLAAAMETVRALDRRRGRGGRPPTVGERPTRVLAAGMFALASGATAGWSPGWADLPWPALGAGLWALAGAAGLVQLVAAGSGRADEPGDDLG